MKVSVCLPLATTASCLLLVSCGWVDSAGEQGVEVPVTEVFLDDMPVGNAIVLNEQTRASLTTSRVTGAAVEYSYVWSEQPLEEGALDSCVALPDFNEELAAASLAEACTDADDCSLDFQPVENEDGEGEFTLLAPTLQAPVGFRQQLTVTDSDGRQNISEYDFCLVAINEAPVAQNDTFVLLEGMRLEVGADDLNLLSNDSDDIDVSNDSLMVLTEAEQDPEFASFFELDADGSGGFVYESSLTGILTDQIDSFVYQLSDGVHVSTATATIRIVSRNQAPEQIDEIPELVAVEGEDFVENLGLYFVDPEQVDLSYSLAASTPLPDDGDLTLDAEGVLEGVPGEDDIGTHSLTLIVSDGGATVQVALTLVVEAAPEVENTAPEFVEDTVFDQIILLGRSIRPVEPEFIDADGDTLTYSMDTGDILPDGVEIDEDTGVISGLPEEVIYARNLRVVATDPDGETAISDAFYIRVR